MPCGTIGTDASVEALYARRETTYKEGGAAADLLAFPFENHSLQGNVTFEDNPLIFAGRQRGLGRLVSRSATGDINTRLSFGETIYEQVLESAFFTDTAFSGQAEIGILDPDGVTAGQDDDVTFDTSTTNEVNISVVDDTPFTSVVVGDVIRLGGMDATVGVSGTATGDAALLEHRHLRVITKASANDITCAVDATLWATLTGGTAIFDTSAIDTALYVARPSYIQNGATCDSFYIERQFSTIAGQHIGYEGMVPSSTTLSAALGESMAFSRSWLGSLENPDSAAGTQGDGAPTPAIQNDLISAIDTIEVIENGTVVAALRSFSFTLDNALRARENLGVSGAVSIGSDVPAIGGSGVLEFSDATFMERFEADTANNFLWRIVDIADRAYIIDAPEARVTEAPTPNTGQGNDLLTNFSWTAGLDPVHGFTCRMYRVPTP